MVWAISIAAAAILDVGSGQPYSTVSDAIAGASDGDEIVVHDASITETVTVDGLELEIRAATRTTWDAHTHVTLSGDGSLVLAGFDLTGAGNAILVLDGALVVRDCSFTDFTAVTGAINDESGDDAVTVVGSVFINTERAIRKESGGTVTVSHSKFLQSGPWVISAAESTLLVAQSEFIGTRGTAIEAINTPLTVEDSLFLANRGEDGAAIFAEARATLVGMPVTLVRNRFCDDDHDLGTLWLNNVPATIRNNLFRGNGSVLNAWNPHEVVLEHNTFLHNVNPGSSGAGTIALMMGTSATSILGNLVALSDVPTGETALMHYTYGPVTLDHNLWWGNAPAAANIPLGATDLVGVRPMLARDGGRCTWDDVRPLPGSPLVDGNPTLLDADGTWADIGATGGPEAP